MAMRKEDWPTRLDEVFADYSRRPFQYGVNDCCTFTSDCVEAMTCIRLIGFFPHRYLSRAGCDEAIEKFAGAGLLHAVSKVCDIAGFEQIPPVFAQRGDIVIMHEADPAVGICNGRFCMFMTDPKGLIEVRSRWICSAWRV